MNHKSPRYRILPAPVLDQRKTNWIQRLLFFSLPFLVSASYVLAVLSMNAMCQTIFFFPVGEKIRESPVPKGLWPVNTQKLQSCVTHLLTKFPGLAFFKLFCENKESTAQQKILYFIMQEVTYFREDAKEMTRSPENSHIL